MFNKLFRYWRTVKHLKFIQVRYQLYYRLRHIWGRRTLAYDRELSVEERKLECKQWIYSNPIYKERTFRFLNKSKRFEKNIDWNFAAFGKLWTYNLNYFDYLLQPGMDRDTGLMLIHDFINKYEELTDGLEAYPISLRAINWIKFCLKFNITNHVIRKNLSLQLKRLEDNLEYHLMGNHLLENGCTLLIGGVYLEDYKFLKRGKQILSTQLNEQILEDGAHYERSPMYHQLLLHRVMDCYNILSASAKPEEALLEVLKTTIEQMLGWLAEVTFRNGTIPCVNDATEGIAPSTDQLESYARRLEIKTEDTTLGESGYRMIRNSDYECFIDVGNIAPDYIPGHAHSDTFSFTLNVGDYPMIVDTGISTYDECDRRITERSTAAHNTVKINGEEQTEVWKSFRVGRRAYITKLEEGPNNITAEHDGYEHLGYNHRRTLKWDKEELYIKDDVMGKKKVNATAYIHFHPQINIEKMKDSVFTNDLEISFSGHDNIKIKPYQYAAGFNQLEKASVLEINFRDSLESRILL